MEVALELLGKPHPKPKPPMALETVFSDALATWFIPVSAVLGIAFALWLWQRVSAIKVRGGAGVRSETGREYLLEEEQRGESEVRGGGGAGAPPGAGVCVAWPGGRDPRPGGTTRALVGAP